MANYIYCLVETSSGLSAGDIVAIVFAILFFIALICGGVFLGWWWWSRRQAQKGEEDYDANWDTISYTSSASGVSGIGEKKKKGKTYDEDFLDDQPPTRVENDYTNMNLQIDLSGESHEQPMHGADTPQINTPYEMRDTTQISNPSYNTISFRKPDMPPPVPQRPPPMDIMEEPEAIPTYDPFDTSQVTRRGTPLQNNPLFAPSTHPILAAIPPPIPTRRVPRSPQEDVAYWTIPPTMDQTNDDDPFSSET